MKLILLLVAIYSLIFYQQYKIEKSNASGPGSKGSFNPEESYHQPGLPDKKKDRNADMIRSYFSIYRYSSIKEPQITRAAVYE